MQNSSLHYNEGFDCLLDLARDHLTHSLSSQNREELREKWKLFCNTEEMEESIEQGFEAFSEDLRLALSYLGGLETIQLTKYSNQELLQRSFNVIDTMLFLNNLIESQVEMVATNISLDFQMEIQKNSLEMFVNKKIPSHRFIAVNEWRRQQLSSLPVDEQYLFPWYEEWVSLPDSTLGELIVHWQEIVVNRDVSWLDIDDALAWALISAIEKDPPFYQFLQTSAGVNKQCVEMLLTSIPLSLMVLCNALNNEEYVSNQFAKNGDTVLASRAILRPLSSEQERYERLFLAALFGPELSSAERLGLFKQLGTWLEEQPLVSRQSLAWRMLRWVDDRLTAPDLVTYGSQAWRLLLDQAPHMVPSLPANFSLALCSLWQIPVEGLAIPMSKIIERFRATIPSVRLLPNRTELESLFVTLFPVNLAFGSAASGASCQYLNLREVPPSVPDYLEVETTHLEFADGVITYTGRIDFDPSWPYPNLQHCGFITTQGEVYCAQSFALDANDYTFHSEFLMDRELKGTLRILLIHEL
jgi:hypothetical protein